MTADLKKSVEADAFGVKNVSASFGRQIARSAILAIIVSLLLIVGYISLRFQWQFAVPAIVALAHDILITVGIYALLGREVTTATVAAVLTVLGYSIYDTIIIFDRIRENIPLMKRGSFRQITNVSLWETIPRSLATTFITLLPILSLLVFGGATLNDFAFALLIGIASGAYSSIFVAAPLLDWIKEREPEWARRRHEDAGAIQSVGGTVLVGSATLAEEAESCSLPSPRRPLRCRRRLRRASSGRERRRARRSTRPHGRALTCEMPPARCRVCVDSPHGRQRHGATSEPHSFEQLLLAGLGWLSSRAEAVDDIADDLAHRAGIAPERMRSALRDAFASWRARRREARRGALGEPPTGPSSSLGLVRREEADDLALRLAQLEHRMRLLETSAGVGLAGLSRRPRAEWDDGDDGEATAAHQPPVRDRPGCDAPRFRLPDRSPARQRQATHLADRGRRLREMLDELGPTFVKFGQLLSTRPDVMPPDIVAELRKLQDDVSPIPFTDVRRVVEEELGLTVEQAFLSFDETPIAAASIGQVHRAMLPTGGQVVVKVQRPEAPRQIESDLQLMRSAARVVRERVRSLDFIDAEALVEEFGRSIRQELDYQHEARNAETFRRNFARLGGGRRAPGDLALLVVARAHARAARREPVRRPRPRHVHARAAARARLPDDRRLDDDDLPARVLPRRPTSGEHHRCSTTAASGSSTSGWRAS